MSEQNPYLEKSEAEIERQLALIMQAKEAKGAALDVAAVIALKWALTHLRGRDKLGEAFAGISPQALPKESNAAKPAGFSETQVDNIRKAVVAGLEAAAKKF